MLLLPLALVAAAPSLTVAPATVDRAETQTVTGTGWPVIEFCERRARVRLESGQDVARLGSARVRRNGRFTFTWNAEAENVGSGRWRLVVRVRCDIGEDGRPVFQTRKRPIRVRP